MKIDISIWFLPLFLFILTAFLFSLSAVYHLGIIGVIVFIRTIFVSLTHYRYFKNFDIEIKNNTYNLNFGVKYPFSISFKEEDLLKIETYQSKLFKKPTTIFFLKNGNSIPVEFLKI